MAAREYAMTAMTLLDPIDDITIRNRVGERSFERGVQYFRAGAIFEARRQGATLKARCEGNRAIPYRVQATLGGHGVVSARCTCPVGHEGQCKHVAALLLTWQTRPEEFVEIEDLEASLARRSKGELVALVKQMLRQEPDLELLLETPLPVPGQSRSAHSETYRRQAAAIFRRTGYTYGVDDEIAQALLAIIAIGDDFATQGDLVSAAAVYVGVLDELRDQYAAYDDEEEILPGVGQRCIDGLGRCLASESGLLPERERWLRALWKTYAVDVALGATSLSRRAASTILDHATPAERRLVVSWVRDELLRARDNLCRAELREFLLDLELDFLEDDQFYPLCRETGRYARLIDRLLERHRLADAIEEARQLDDDLILDVTNTFERHQHLADFERLLAERTATTTNPRILEWLQRRNEAGGDLNGALAHAARLLDLRDSFDDYRELRRLARTIGDWTALRNLTLAKLRGRGSRSTLIQIYLDEGDVDRALELVSGSNAAPRGVAGSDFRLALEVARAAEASRPRAACEIYQHYAEHLIAQRGRNNYATACDVLRRIRTLLASLGETTAWENYLAGLRQKNRSLRAFQDELELAGL